MKKTTLAILLTLGLGTATLLACGGPKGHKGGDRGDRMMKMVKQLDLNATQKSELKAMREAAKAERKIKREERKANRKNMQGQMKPDMGQFMTADHFDKEAFKAQMNQNFEAKRAMMEGKKATMLERRADKMEKVFNVLTPEQRIKWIELSKQQGKKCTKK